MRRTRFWIANVVVALITLTATTAAAEGRAAPRDPCARMRAYDVLCRHSGTVTHTVAAESVAPRRVVGRSLRVPPNSTVHVDRFSSASVNFAREARCRFGVGGVETLFTTRFENGGSARSLFWQETGNSRCTILRRREQRFFCDDTIRCGARITTSTGARTSAAIGVTARIAQLAPGVEVSVTPVTFDFCARRYRLEITDANGSSTEVGGESYATINGVTELAHERVTIKKVDTVTRTEMGTTESHTLSISARGEVGSGRCIVR